jgi:prepilin-type N-terminal cleavage/methylation domain-containing protein
MNRGFTLIELLISMTILTFISVFVYQTTSKSFELRDSLSTDGDFYNSIRIALDIFGRDVIHIYSPQMAALPGKLSQAEQPQNNFPTPYSNDNNQEPTLDLNVYPFWGAMVNKFGVRPTRFIGDENKISFITNSHMRLFRESHECEFAKITYELSEDKLAPKSAAKVFIKKENTDVFSLDRENKDTEIRYDLLTGVKALRFRYLDSQKDQWLTRWDSTSRDFNNRFPNMIEIELDVELPRSGNIFTVMQRFRPELPL